MGVPTSLLLRPLASLYCLRTHALLASLYIRRYCLFRSNIVKHIGMLLIQHTPRTLSAPTRRTPASIIQLRTIPGQPSTRTHKRVWVYSLPALPSMAVPSTKGIVYPVVDCSCVRRAQAFAPITVYGFRRAHEFPPLSKTMEIDVAFATVLHPSSPDGTRLKAIRGSKCPATTHIFYSFSVSTF